MTRTSRPTSTTATSSAPSAPAAAEELPPPRERRRLREAKALSQAQVAAIVGVTRETVRSWETGRTSPRGRKREVYTRLLAGIARELRTQGEAVPVRTAGPAAVGRKPASPATPKSPGTPKPSAARKPPTTARPTAAAASSAPSTAPDTQAAPDTQTALTSPDAPTSPDTPTSPDALTSPDAPSVVPTPATSDASAVTDIPAAPPAPAPQAAEAPQASEAAEAAHPGDESEASDASDVSDEAPSGPADAAEPEAERPTPTQAFDHLYSRTAPSLLRQTYLLTGRHRLSRESVERAFDLAWQRWPEVATDRDPAGWVRAAAYEYAMSPWHRLRPRHRHVDPPVAADSGAAEPGSVPARAPGPGERALLHALLELPPPYRRTLVLYDGLGLDLPETAAETEASTPATANRIVHARSALAHELPELAEARTPADRSRVVQERLSTLALARSLDDLPPGAAVRTKSERRTRFWTRAAIAFTTLIIGATAFTLSTAPTQYEAPRPPGEPVGGVPARSGPQHLSRYDMQLRDQLRAEPDNGPERLVPQSR
ncbi:sigma factor-like helix-turn-helix DNA-binding protein [Streptomyces sp. NPDC004111]|uniref:sigma factor-like helix-turn-helix DNA-binding protein n=1 Tax=Streptomyces sp. NPDC004111 TaxID=3364690 RepID=UPI0036B4C24D